MILAWGNPTSAVMSLVKVVVNVVCASDQAHLEKHYGYLGGLDLTVERKRCGIPSEVPISFTG